jgi:hypothetical protein
MSFSPNSKHAGCATSGIEASFPKCMNQLVGLSTLYREQPVRRVLGTAANDSYAVQV